MPILSHTPSDTSGVPAVLILGMYNVQVLNSAPPVRITHMFKALGKRVPTILIHGGRERQASIARFILHGGLRNLRGLYVETCSGPAIEADLLLMVLARLLQIPIATFIGDAFQLFYPTDRRRLRLERWRASIAAYLRLSDVLYYPSDELGRIVSKGRPYRTLPPGGEAGLPIAPLPHASRVLYVGGISRRYGTDLLLAAMERVVARLPEARCTIVGRPAEMPFIDAWRDRPWLDVREATADQLPPLLAQSTVGVIPLRREPYNNLAMAVKLLEYISVGRPVVATDCDEQATFVREHGCGIVVPDTVAGLADGLIRVLSDRAWAEQMGLAGYRAIQEKHSWQHRADTLLAALDEVHRSRPSPPRLRWGLGGYL